MYSLRSSTRRDDRPRPSASPFQPGRNSIRSTRSTTATPQPSSTIDPISKERRTELLQTIRAKRSLPSLSTAPRVPTTISDIPAEVKHLVASYLDTPDRQSLVRVNRQWRGVVEPFNWERISVYSRRRGTMFDRDPDVSLECWTNLAATVIARPDLAAQVDSFTFVPKEGAETTMMTVLRAFAPTLREMDLQCDCCADCSFIECSNLHAGSMLIDAIRILPKLSRLTCSLGPEDWIAQLYRVLRSTPSLQYLSIDVTDIYRVSSAKGLQYADPVLPSLEELSINAFHLIRVAATLLKGSAALRHLTLHCDMDEDDDDDEPQEIAPASALQTILQHDALARLDLAPLLSPPIRDAILSAKQGNAVQHLRTLKLFAPPCEPIPYIPNLETLCIGALPGETTHFFARRPTADTTGLLARWAISLFKSQPNLTRLVITDEHIPDSWTEEKQGTTGFHCRVYANRYHELYHVRARVEDIPPRLLTTQGELPLTRQADLPLRAAKQEIVCDGMAADGWLDFTSFLGRAVPKKMMGEMARDAGHERLWHKGERDLTLSDEVWQKLKDWRFDVMVKENAEAFK